MTKFTRCELDSHYYRLEVREPGGDWMGPYQWALSDSKNSGKINVMPDFLDEPIIRGPWLYQRVMEVWDSIECYYTPYGWDTYLDDEDYDGNVCNHLCIFDRRTKEAGLEYQVLEVNIEDLPGPIVWGDKNQIVCNMMPQKDVPFNKLRRWSGDQLWNAWGI